MSRLKSFRFKWESFMLYCGYRSELMLGGGCACLDFLIDGEKYSLDLTGREDEFISDMLSCGVEEWNDKKYCDPFVYDGSRWTLYFIYDDKTVLSMGHNGYPKDFDSFLEVLHKKWKLPYSEYDRGGKKNRYEKTAEGHGNLAYRQGLYILPF